MWAYDGGPDRLLRGISSDKTTDMRSERKALSSRARQSILLVAHGYNLSRDKQARSWRGAALMRLAARQAKHCVFVYVSVSAIA